MIVDIRLVEEHYAVALRMTHAATRDDDVRVTPVGENWPFARFIGARWRAGVLQLVVIGTFNDNTKAEFDKQASDFGLSENIRTVDWMPFSEAYVEIQRADIGLVQFQPGIQNNVFALPHKMFDYMMAGLPVIAPDFAVEVADIVREADCGILVDPAKPEEIAAALERLIIDPDERARLGRNGQRAVQELYNWEAEAAKLIATYRELEILK